MTPNQIAAVVYRHTGRDLADEAWRRTLAALNRDGGVSICQRAGMPIEDDALDARDEARRAREDEQREEAETW